MGIAESILGFAGSIASGIMGQNIADTQAAMEYQKGLDAKKLSQQQTARELRSSASAARNRRDMAIAAVAAVSILGLAISQRVKTSKK